MPTYEVVVCGYEETLGGFGSMHMLPRTYEVDADAPDEALRVLLAAEARLKQDTSTSGLQVTILPADRKARRG